ncbi:MAG TPA: pirin family protein [Stellaceae bacterium]|nr:pirin family protein [Stellaceae bacterium]
MSWQPAPEAAAAPAPAGPVEMAILPRTRDLGDGFTVRRVLPFAKRRMVGPFIFFDAMGPTVFRAGTGLDVRPHPHIGLATVTYLFDGEILHRDSLGNVQPIRPGEVNWMVAGSGIAHSERTDAVLRQKETRLCGIQSWVALPREHEEMAPLFSHHGTPTLPLIEGRGKRVRLIAGAMSGKKAPVETFSPMFYADATLEQGERVVVPAEYEERATFLVSGAVAVDGETHAAGQLLLFRAGAEIALTAAGGAARLMLLGGDPLEGPRHIWWNFVSSRPERIETAKSDWKNGRFARVAGDNDFIPLPE